MALERGCHNPRSLQERFPRSVSVRGLDLVSSPCGQGMGTAGGTRHHGLVAAPLRQLLGAHNPDGGCPRRCANLNSSSVPSQACWRACQATAASSSGRTPCCPSYHSGQWALGWFTKNSRSGVGEDGARLRGGGAVVECPSRLEGISREEVERQSPSR